MNLTAQNKVLDIDKKLSEIEINIDKYVSNYDLSQLGEQLAQSINSKNKHVNSDNLNGIKDIQLKDSDYIEQIDVCNKLWLLGGSINELESLKSLNEPDDWKLINFEMVVSSFVKLNNKAQELFQNFSKKYGGSIKIFNDLTSKIDEYNDSILKLIQLNLHEYLQFNDELEVTYHNVFGDIIFGDFLKTCNHFINYNSEEGDLSKLFNFNKMFNDWLQQALEKLDSGYNVVFLHDMDSIKILFKKSDCSFMNFTKSIEDIINFFNVFLDLNGSDLKYKPFQNFKYILNKTILKYLKTKMFSKENIYPLIIDNMNKSEHTSSSSMIRQLQLISGLLSQQGWSKDGICDLEFWIEDLGSSWVNSLVENTIDDLKNLVLDMRNGKYQAFFENSNLVAKELSASRFQEHKKSAHELEKASKSIRETNEWNTKWDEDEDENGAWNDEIDLDLGNESNEENEKKLEHNVKIKEKEEEEENDAWNQEIDLDIDSLDTNKADGTKDDKNSEEWDSWNNDTDWKEKKNESSRNPVNETFTYKYSKITVKVSQIYANFYSNLNNLKELVNCSSLEEVDSFFKHGFRKLAISYLMMTEFDVDIIYPSKILFYNDYSKILEEAYLTYHVDLTSCFKMGYKFINNYSSEIANTILNLVSDYDEALFADEYNNISVTTKMKDKFTSQFKLRFNKLNQILLREKDLNTQLVNNIFVTAIFKLFDILCEKILSRNDISSEESALLSELIIEVVNIIVQVSCFSININKIQSYNKLDQIRLILSGNLKDILEQFYDAKFYDIETTELIGLIKALFVESSMRENTIAQIESTRESSS